MATYLIINFIVIIFVLAFLRLHRTYSCKGWWIALFVLLILTAIFDNIIVGIDIVGYAHGKILGILIGHVPLEDFFYAVAAMLIVPALWNRRAKDE